MITFILSHTLAIPLGLLASLSREATVVVAFESERVAAEQFAVAVEELKLTIPDVWDLKHIELDLGDAPNWGDNATVRLPRMPPRTPRRPRNEDTGGRGRLLPGA